MKEHVSTPKRTAKPKNRPISIWQKWRMGRRFSQTVFLLLFIFLIFATAALTGAGFDAKNSTEVSLPVEAFLNFDPLAYLVVLLSTFTVPATLVWSLITITLTVILGRFFCGWICPMGTINHGLSEFKSGLTKKQKREANQPHPGQKSKYLILTFTLSAAFFGSALAGLFDPLSILTRGIALTVLPIVDYLLSALTSANVSSTAYEVFSNAVWETTNGTLMHQQNLISTGGLLLSLLFIGILLANRFMPRFWCRYLCPLGALLGVSGRFGLIALKKDEEKCTKCKKCIEHCSGAASPLPGETWQRAECDLCLNCVAICPDDALSFGLSGWTNQTIDDGPNLEKRKWIGTAAAGALAVPLMRTQQSNNGMDRPDPARIRPPGAVDEPDFLKRCIRCGQCMKICPNNALHPAFDEAGIEGVGTPILVPSVGYCESTCTLCSQVCPTAAIRRVEEKQRNPGTSDEFVKMGTAFIDRGRCLPFSMNTPCTVCEEFCPVSPKAIQLDDETKQIEGKTVTLKQPHVNPSQCTGCGACEHACPVHDRPAIKVSSAGESRSSKNKLML